MTIKAAGIMLLCRTGDGETALFVKRGEGSDYPGCWAFPGGRCEDGEALEECAERETREEIGPAPYSGLAVWTRRVAAQETTGVAPTPPTGAPPDGLPSAPPGDAIVVPGEQVDFTTFAARVKDQFRPTLGDEHTGWAWARVDQPPEPLHPGCRIALDRIGMDELGIARAIAAGELTSPQRYQNLWLFAIRITGTGLAYRTKWEEFVWRDSSLYLNDEFLARCNGLPVVWEHPPTDTLNSKEFAKRIVGTVMLPYIQGNDVWAVAKILDADAAREMESKQLSTSPAVVLRDSDATKMTTEGGQTLLIEGKPILLDHIAICAAGVWDKQGPPNGVDIGDLRMAADDDDAKRKADAEEKERADAAKRMADATGNIDKLLSGLDSMARRMDDFGSRMDAHSKRMDDDDAKRRDDARRSRHDDDDDARRKRADEAAEKCADDDDDDKARRRMDAEEAEEREEREKEGEAKEVAADKARKHRSDKESWRADRRAKKDAAKKDDDDAKRRKDDDDTKRRSDAEIARRVADALAALPKRTDDKDGPAFADAQSRADTAYSAFGQRAPGPLQGEDLISYRRRLTRGMQQHSADWKDVDLATADTKVLGIAEVRIFADAVVASRSPDGLPDFALVPHSYTNPDTGHRITEWRGKHTFIWGLKRPSLRATAFMTGKGN